MLLEFLMLFCCVVGSYMNLSSSHLRELCWVWCLLKKTLYFFECDNSLYSFNPRKFLGWLPSNETIFLYIRKTELTHPNIVPLIMFIPLWLAISSPRCFFSLEDYFEALKGHCHAWNIIFYIKMACSLL